MLQLLTLKRLVAFPRGPASRSFLAANCFYSNIAQSTGARRMTQAQIIDDLTSWRQFRAYLMRHCSDI